MGRSRFFLTLCGWGTWWVCPLQFWCVPAAATRIGRSNFPRSCLQRTGSRTRCAHVVSLSLQRTSITCHKMIPFKLLFCVCVCVFFLCYSFLSMKQQNTSCANFSRCYNFAQCICSEPWSGFIDTENERLIRTPQIGFPRFWHSGFAARSVCWTEGRTEFIVAGKVTAGALGPRYTLWLASSLFSRQIGRVARSLRERRGTLVTPDHSYSRLRNIYLQVGLVGLWSCRRRWWCDWSRGQALVSFCDGTQMGLETWRLRWQLQQVRLLESRSSFPRVLFGPI